ncbi:hypothetical protein FGA82_09005 [Pseudomonas fluorescens]|uniref:hypothetical protein n=1 Tax=Pseudomonas fluorescens TaxID=294 RepID=UPI0011324E5B|nr:hypothetical protein [Pseudomonas fluorescens]TMU80611.1 hypothetical protein FGA82_09005 [Pseudomonas fluorescens]
MNAPLNVNIKRINSFTAKILRNETQDFNANYFKLERGEYPGFEGIQWTLIAAQIDRIGERVDTKTITLIFPEDTASGTFFIPEATKGLSIDYVDSSDAEPYIHLATKGAVFLTITRKGDEVSEVSGNFDVTVSDANDTSFKISGEVRYNTAIY